MVSHTQILPTSDREAIATALKVLHSGGVIAFPTDTVYGVATLAFDPKGIDNLFQVKGRDTSKAIAVLIGAQQQLSLVAAELNDIAQRLAKRFWPGALTLVVPRHPALPANLSPTPTIGVRMPDHSFVLDLLRASGPLATTSANRSGSANPLTAQDVIDQLGGRIELVLDGGTCPGGIPSTVVDCTVSPPVILRQGAIPPADIFKVSDRG